MNYFSRAELACKHCNKYHFDDAALAKFNAIRHECGFAFIVSSGYRCPEHPIEARKAKPGAHASGKAIDIAVDGERAIKVLEVAIKHGIRRIGVQQKGTSRFIHLDTCDESDGMIVPALWSY
jgi:uncharacterized protein YcbK (DUF882 family)